MKATLLATCLATLPLFPAPAANVTLDVNGSTEGFGSYLDYNEETPPDVWWDTTSSLWTASVNGSTATTTWAAAGGGASTITAFQVETSSQTLIGVGGNFTVGGLLLNTTVNSGYGYQLRNYDETNKIAKTITLASGATITVTNGTGGSGVPALIINNSNGGILLSGDFEKLGTGGLRMQTAYSGTITLTEGSIALENRDIANASTHFIIGPGGQLNWVGSAATAVIGNLSGSGSVERGSGSANLGVTITQTTDQTFSGRIGQETEKETGYHNIIKAGNAALTLSGSNTYRGTTTVSAGTLVAAHNNALSANSGGVTVNNTAGATLRINGGITLNAASNVTLGGTNATIDVGTLNNTGTAGLLGSLTATSGGTFQFDLNGTSAVDLLTIGGTTTLSGAFTFNLTDLGGTSFLAGEDYLILDTLGGYDFTGATFALGLTPTGWIGGSITEENGDLYVSFAAVPEPSSFLLMGAGALGLAFWRRRRSFR